MIQQLSLQKGFYSPFPLCFLQINHDVDVDVDVDVEHGDGVEVDVDDEHDDVVEVGVDDEHDDGDEHGVESVCATCRRLTGTDRSCPARLC